MNAAQLAHAAKQNAVDRDFPYGRASFNGVGALAIPVSSRTKLSNWKGRVTWTINGERATKAAVQALLG